MNTTEEKRLLEKMSLCYGAFYSPEELENIVCDIAPLLQPDSKYRKPIKEWMNGKTAGSEIQLTCLDGESVWSLQAIARNLHENIPNVPVAALLLSAYEEFPIILSQIIPIAAETCWCDGRILRDESPVCTAAELDKETEQWFFLLPDTQPQDLVFCQLWQVLTQVPALAPIIFLEHEPGTLVERWEDGRYRILPPEESVW